MAMVDLIGESELFHQLLEDLSKVAKLSKSVLIIGERGTGKELIADRIHYLSPRWDQNFIKLNCATLPEELLASELFGHEPGSFTGATHKHVGRFERAHHGTIFLDEIANTSCRLQEIILRVVQYGEYERVGGNTTIKTDVRIVAATNVDLPSEVDKGNFRADLLDRLAFDVLTLPPLRYRGDDIIKLAYHFATKMVQELEGDCFHGFTYRLEQELRNYSWPGNVRELKNVIERAVYKSSTIEGEIDAIQIDPFESPFRPVEFRKLVDEEISFQEGSFKEITEGHEIKLLNQALIRNHYNQKQTAKSLDLTYNQLRGLLRKYAIGK